MKDQERGLSGKRIDRWPIVERRITEREKEVLRLAALGYKNKEIAEELCIKVKTVETHRSNIKNKLGLRNISELIRYAIAKGIAPIEDESGGRFI
ncbi:MAG: response regulator transcription factor [Candidatus Manganitrophaceae bacterium]|nr:MAG: response regulator transcription factor [Candidatus Manganitrophaceae bacterium]